MKLFGTFLAGATLAFAPAALAQTAPQTSPAPATPAAPAAAVTSASVTDAEVSQFAGAALEIEKIRTDATVTDADKPAKMAAAAAGAGLTPERFNAIGQGMQADPALNKRVQTAAAAKLAASGAAPAAKQP